MKVWLVFMVDGKNDRLMSVHATKGSALRWKNECILKGQSRDLRVQDYRDYYVVEKYVLDIWE